MFRIGIRMAGQTHNVVQQMQKADVRDVLSREELQRFAQSIAEDIQLEADIGNFEPLSPETVMAKERRKSPTPEKPWFEKPYLVERLFLKPVVRFYKSGSVTVTLPTSNATHPRAKMPLSALFGILEEGSGKIPPRPIMAPVFDRIESGQSVLLDELQEKIKDNLENLLR